MKKIRFTEAQKAFILTCLNAGLFIGDFTPQEFKRLKKVEKENDQLKRLVADLTLEKETIKNKNRPAS